MEAYNLSDVKSATGLTTTEVTLMVRAGTFPSPFLDDGKFRWRAQEVNAWVADYQPNNTDDKSQG